MDPFHNARELAQRLQTRAGEARSKARAASHANVQFTRGDTSFSAGAGADAGAAAAADTAEETQKGTHVEESRD